MKQKGPPRWPVLGGIVFAILGVLGTVVLGTTPDFVGDPAEIATFYKEESGAVLAGNSVYLLAGFFLLWFVAGLRTGLERADGAGSPLAAVALVGGTAGAALMIGSAAIGIVGALRADEQGSIDPQVAAALYDVSNIMYGAAAPMAWAAAVLATAVVALRSSALPWRSCSTCARGRRARPPWRVNRPKPPSPRNGSRPLKAAERHPGRSAAAAGQYTASCSAAAAIRAIPCASASSSARSIRAEPASPRIIISWPLCSMASETPAAWPQNGPDFRPGAGFARPPPSGRA